MNPDYRKLFASYDIDTIGFDGRTGEVKETYDT